MDGGVVLLDGEVVCDAYLFAYLLVLVLNVLCPHLEEHSRNDVFTSSNT